MIEGFNTPFAVRVLARIEDAREMQQQDAEAPLQWNQSLWSAITGFSQNEEPELDALYDAATGKYIGNGTCGTAQCFAGWGASIAGIRLEYEYIGDNTWEASRTVDGDDIAPQIAELLGIYAGSEGWHEFDDFPTLFNAENSIETLYSLIARYAGITLAELQDHVAYQRRQDAQVLSRVNQALLTEKGQTEGRSLT